MRLLTWIRGDGRHAPALRSRRRPCVDGAANRHGSTRPWAAARCQGVQSWGVMLATGCSRAAVSGVHWTPGSQVRRGRRRQCRGQAAVDFTAPRAVARRDGRPDAPRRAAAQEAGIDAGRRRGLPRRRSAGARHPSTMVAVVMVVAMMVMVARGTRVRRHGEHRQHGGDGKQLGEVHGEPLSSFVNDRTGVRGRHHTQAGRSRTVPSCRGRRVAIDRGEPRSGLTSCRT